MTKIEFITGPVSTGKTMKLLIMIDQIKRSYGKDKIFLIKSSFDTRSSKKEFLSATGIGVTTDLEIDNDFDLSNINFNSASYIILDEVQFFTVEQINQLVNLAYEKDINLILCGINNDFRGEMFPSVKRAFEIADEVLFTKSYCYLCGLKKHIKPTFTAATQSMKIQKLPSGKLVRCTGGSSYLSGGIETFIPVCNSCFFTSSKNSDENNNNLNVLL